MGKMNKKIELTGKRFGKLIIAEQVGKDKHQNQLWKCFCDCGNITVAQGGHLRSGHTKSCGCWKKEAKTTHGMTKTLTYFIWSAMVQRCTNPHDKDYSYYGGRGIFICKRWLAFAKFFEDMGIKPKDLTIERIDNEKGYYKENCKWATRTEQMRNQRINKNNKTGITGVGWHKLRQKYRAHIMTAGKSKHLGLFNTLEEAIIARKKAEQKYWNGYGLTGA